MSPHRGVGEKALFARAGRNARHQVVGAPVKEERYRVTVAPRLVDNPMNRGSIKVVGPPREKIANVMYPPSRPPEASCEHSSARQADRSMSPRPCCYGYRSRIYFQTAAQLPEWVIHVIPPMPACPVCPESGHSSNARARADFCVCDAVSIALA